uniref:Uncharacterized protein n=1 Tax=Anguilla anguilla TaxID=7936 RepID=A0A0E9TKR3_ANGAN
MHSSQLFSHNVVPCKILSIPPGEKGQ